jgi:hypothetical protein
VSLHGLADVLLIGEQLIRLQQSHHLQAAGGQ